MAQIYDHNFHVKLTVVRLNEFISVDMRILPNMKVLQKNADSPIKMHREISWVIILNLT